MIVLAGRKIPPTVAERKAAARARIHRHLRIADVLLAALIIPAAVVGLWLLLHLETGWAVTSITLAALGVARAYWRLADVPAVEMPR